MTKFGTLLKVNLRQLFRARKNTSKKTMPVWGIYIVLGVVLLPLLAMLFSTFVSAGEFLSEPQYAPYLNAAVTFAITAIELVNVFFRYAACAACQNRHYIFVQAGCLLYS